MIKILLETYLFTGQLAGGYPQYPTTSGSQIPSASQTISPGEFHF